MNTGSPGEKLSIQQHFDQYAGQWDQRIRQHGYHSRFLVVKDMLKRLPVPRAAVDVGCGTGDYCVLFDPAKTHYVGIDISEEMVARCRELYPAFEFQAGDGDRLPLPDGSADVILDVAVIEYYADPLPHLRELARVARPGGSIFVVGPNGNNRSRRVAIGLDRFIQAVRGRSRPATSSKLVQHRYRTVNDLRSLGETAGLRLAEYEFSTLYILPELHPSLRRLNIALSERIGGRPNWQWITRWSATNLICRFVKP